MAESAPARTARDERRIVHVFRHQRALTGASAQPLLSLGLLDSRALRRMVTDTIVRRAGPHRYFLDEGAWAAQRPIGGRNALRIVVGIALAMATTIIFLAGR